MTLGEGLLVAIVVLLMMACGLLGYGVCLQQKSIQTQRRLVWMSVTIHWPPNALTQEDRPARV